MRRRSLGALVACMALMAAAAPAAHASNAYITDDGTHKVLHFVADPGETNSVGVAAPTGETYVTVTDTSDITVGAGCTLLAGSTSYALCDKAGLTEIDADLGDRDDQFGFASADGVPFVVDGGDGNDTLDAPGGSSRLDGGPGNDSFNADADANKTADELVGGTGDDTIYYNNRQTGVSISLDGVANDGAAGEGDDVHADVEHVYGGLGDDTIAGGAGDDDLHGLGGTDTLSGLGGDDTLDGGIGCDADVLAGGAGDDTLVVTGTGQVDGGPDDDTLKTGLGSCGRVDVHGGSGHDTADLRSVSYDDASFSLDDVADDGWNDSENWHADIEDVVGGDRGMYLIGSPGPNVLTGGAGDDLLQGGGGADTLIGGGGVDVADYSDRTGAVSLTLDGAADDGAPGEDDDIAGDVEDLRGGDGNDTLAGDGQDNVLDGGPGADMMSGGGGTDAVDYSFRSAPVRVDLAGTPGDDGEAGEGDTVAGDVEGVFGGDGDDTLIGGTGDGFIDGGPGDDTITDPGGDDGLFGDEGDDVIDSVDGAADVDSCGDGHDQVWRDAADAFSTDCESVTVGPRGTAPDTPRAPVGTPHLPAIHVGVNRPASPPITPARAIDKTAPTASWVRLGKGVRLSQLLKRGFDVDVMCSEKCWLTGKLVARGTTARALKRHHVAAGVTLAYGTQHTVNGGRVHLKVTATGRRALAHLRSASLELVLTLSDQARNKRQVTRSLAFKP